MSRIYYIIIFLFNFFNFFRTYAAVGTNPKIGRDKQIKNWMKPFAHLQVVKIKKYI